MSMYARSHPDDEEGWANLPRYADFQIVREVRGTPEAKALAESMSRHPAGKAQKEND